MLFQGLQMTKRFSELKDDEKHELFNREDGGKQLLEKALPQYESYQKKIVGKYELNVIKLWLAKQKKLEY